MHKLTEVFSVNVCAFSSGVALSVWRRSGDFLRLFSACVAAKVQTVCVWVMFVGETANGL